MDGWGRGQVGGMIQYGLSGKVTDFNKPVLLVCLF